MYVYIKIYNESTCTVLSNFRQFNKSPCKHQYSLKKNISHLPLTAHQGLWILSREEAISLAYRTLVSAGAWNNVRKGTWGLPPPVNVTPNKKKYFYQFLLLNSQLLIIILLYGQTISNFNKPFYEIFCINISCFSIVRLASIGKYVEVFKVVVVSEFERYSTAYLRNKLS